MPGTYRTRAGHGAHGRHTVHRAHSTYGDKAAWYLPLALAVDALGIAVPVVMLLRHTEQPHPLVCAVVAAASWLVVRVCRRRYAADALGETSGVLAVLGDWLVLLGVLAVLRTAFGEIVRPSVALAALTAGPLLTLAGRKATYHHLIAARRSAQAVRRVLVIGEPSTADHVVGHLAARTEHAYVVVGVVPVGSAKLECGAPVTERLPSVEPRGPAEDAESVLRAVHELHAELVLLSPGPRLHAERLRRLSWALHDAGVPLAVLPGLVDVAVRRVQVDAPAGLTMLHIAPPARRGVQMALKTALDRSGSALGLLMLLPLFALTAAAIRLTSAGPVFHRQTRFGRHGRPFVMWKFRTMVADAESRKAELERTGANENDGLMFKMRRDPRVTAVGRVLRRCSLDELPQLVNVLRGEMSLVGPRPPLPDEVARYDEVELRRLAVKPGITGLWQVSGRSELSWDETLAIDLRYVDNWSFTGDVAVMARTLRAVVDGRGAY
ncbi:MULTISPECIES: sugar transferase [unclassified Streptomyces]|uniref:sugar transferase n=1 Tax=unclassified Streptomyces TaxID=2593676 RepID=UPI002E2CAB63|nr:sugar transferase [Streptomyces sp. NBC_00223]